MNVIFPDDIEKRRVVLPARSKNESVMIMSVKIMEKKLRLLAPVVEFVEIVLEEQSLVRSIIVVSANYVLHTVLIGRLFRAVVINPRTRPIK